MDAVNRGDTETAERMVREAVSRKLPLHFIITLMATVRNLPKKAPNALPIVPNAVPSI